jgi:uncharacterized membrane protein YdcZ (DUF606 family)
MQSAFPAELDGQLGPQLIEVWSFLTGQTHMVSLSMMVGVRPGLGVVSAST